MEVFGLFILLIVYVIVRAIFGKLKDKTTQDREKYKEGLHLIKQQHYQEALNYYTHILRQDERSALAWAMRGKCYLEVGELPAAIADCSKASSFDHCIAEAYLSKAIALYQLKQYEEARLEFDKAVWYSRDKAEALRWRGLLLFELGVPEKARQDLEKAVSLGDEHANYYLLRKGGGVGREL